MAEVPPNSDIDLEMLHQNYLHAGNVRARFLPYEFCRPAEDLEALAVDALSLDGGETIVDVGGADGGFLQRHYVESGHHGLSVCIELNASQYDAEIWRPLSGDPVKTFEVIRRRNPSLSSDIIARAIETIVPRPDTNVHLLQGEATHLPLANQSVDALFAMFMLYHISRQEQPNAFHEFKRVLKPEGKLVVATSGETNKWVHRLFEEDIATHLGIAAPAHMNSGFTSEYAAEQLPQYFRHVYQHDHEAPMYITDDFEVEAYLNSIRSLRNQFVPEPSIDAFEAALAKVVLPEIMLQIATQGHFLDYAVRSLFIGMDESLAVAPKGFRQLC